MSQAYCCAGAQPGPEKTSPPGGDALTLLVVHALAIGFGLGFVVALQLGPMSLFLMRSTLRAGLAAGLAVGAGIALVDLAYAAAGAAGAAAVLGIDGLRLALGLLGATVLAVLGARSLWTAARATVDAGAAGEATTPLRAFATSVGATAANPLTIASWAAIFAAASIGTDANAALLVLGVGAGSLTWTALLALGVAAVRRSVGTRGVRVADTLAGLGMLGFAAALAWQAVG